MRWYYHLLLINNKSWQKCPIYLWSHQLIWNGSVVRVQISLTQCLWLFHHGNLTARGQSWKSDVLGPRVGFCHYAPYHRAVLKRGHFRINWRTCHYTTTFKEFICLRWSYSRKKPQISSSKHEENDLLHHCLPSEAAVIEHDYDLTPNIPGGINKDNHLSDFFCFRGDMRNLCYFCLFWV